MRRIMRVAMPSVPSEPTKTPHTSYPGQSGDLPPMCTREPSGNTTSSPKTCVVVKPYLRQCAPPEFSATLPPILHTDCDDGRSEEHTSELQSRRDLVCR